MEKPLVKRGPGPDRNNINLDITTEAQKKLVMALFYNFKTKMLNSIDYLSQII